MLYILAHPGLDPDALVRKAKREQGLRIAPSYVRSIRWMHQKHSELANRSEMPASSDFFSRHLAPESTLPASSGMTAVAPPAIPPAPPAKGLLEAYVHELGWERVLRQAAEHLGTDRAIEILAKFEAEERITKP